METQSRITLAAGMVKTVADVQRALELPIDEITLGSITLDMKTGNAEPNFYSDGAGNYWNAIGLKNGGAEYYRRELSGMVAMVRSAGRRFVLSISGSSPDENAALVRLYPHECIELNTACPNAVTKDGGRKPLIGYSPMALSDHIAAAATDASLRLKMPPYTDLGLLEEVAQVIVTMSKVVPITSIVATNTIPGCFPQDENGKPRISVGLAGGSGEQLHALAVGNVKKWRELLPPHIEVIGVGGVREARHVLNFERVGATRCQMAGAYYDEGPRAHQHVLQGL